MIDFTNLPIRNKTYAGANGSKISVMYNNELYIKKNFTRPCLGNERNGFLIFHTKSSASASVPEVRKVQCRTHTQITTSNSHTPKSFYIQCKNNSWGFSFEGLYRGACDQHCQLHH